MALVNLDAVLADTLRLVKKAEPLGGVLLLSYKRNRSIAVIRKNADTVEIREQGYEQQVVELGLEKMAKELKVMMKREFPRSRKVRMVKLSDPAELEQERNIL
ncbi:hypothetical protein MASR1M90_10050 [Desulfovibrionales bacterium]